MIRRRVVISGNIQGVGFRPFVWRLAQDWSLSGWVRNDSSGVTLEIQGHADQVDAFLSNLVNSPPPLGQIDSIQTTAIPIDSTDSFVILESVAQQGASTPVSADVAICEDCLTELNDAHDRRFHYPFINCTNCGPRFTIVEDIPYDRPLTTMKSFVMCSQCQQEYEDPSNRRFHAQPNACPDCGPRIWFAVPVADQLEQPQERATPDETEQAIDSFRSAIRQGLIVAVKGIGGFHLACDATNHSAIGALRHRKGRVDKPFAVMVASVESARAFAEVTEDECRLLESRQRPIVLLRKRADPDWRTHPHRRADPDWPVHPDWQGMLDGVAPGNDYVGVMLPYSPLHYLLVDASPALVMTSGNLSDEPIARTNQEAIDRLRPIADCYLFHNREIRVVCDDSVVRSHGGTVLPIRRSRGYSPMPVPLDDLGPSVLAVGGELKATFCVTKGSYAYMSQHIGDMGNIETLNALQRSVDHFLRLFRIDLQAVAADLHPGYLSTQWAKEFARSAGVPLIGVQHHFAHAVSLLAEAGNGGPRQSIACCFDGTGYGTDGAIWGGEFLVIDKQGFDRVAHLEYVPLPGGDASIKRPYRIALAHLWAAGVAWDERLPCVAACGDEERSVLRRQLEASIHCVATSSMGRLFDAVASLLDVRQEITYEAQAAIELEALATKRIDSVDSQRYAFQWNGGGAIEIRCDELLRMICEDFDRGTEKEIIAACFHHAVAKMIAGVSVDIREVTSIHAVGLTGGVFQNVLLSRLAASRLAEAGFEVMTHSIVPSNDGGLALGQALVARERLARAP